MSEKVSLYTQNMMQQFPSWMKMARDETSVGAQFLDVFGFTLEKFRDELDTLVNDFYVGEAKVEMIDILYKIPLATENVPDLDKGVSVFIVDNNGNNQAVELCSTLRSFYEYRDNLTIRSYLDLETSTLYLNLDREAYPNVTQPIKSVNINGTEQFTLILHHVWNAFDELGLFLGLERIFGERNESYKNRIMDVFKNPSNTTKRGIESGLSRELGFESSKVSVNYLNDNKFLDKLTNKDGSPTKKLISYAKRINDTLKFTYDDMNFNEAYWYSVEEENIGIHYLPHVWDVDTKKLPNNYFQSGVGSDTDLIVHKPVEQNSTRNFKSYIGLLGYYEETKELYPEISFKYKIYAKGKVPDENYGEELFKYTIKAAEEFDQPYSIKADQNFDYDYRIDFFDPNKMDKTADTRLIKSNDFLHKATDKVVKLTVRLSTTDEKKSSIIPELNLIYEDTNSTEHSLQINQHDHWLNTRYGKNGNPISIVKYADISVDENNSLSLGRGSFTRNYETTADFQEGYYQTNSILVKNGGITLNLDTIGKIRN